MFVVIEHFLKNVKDRPDELFLHQPMGTFSKTWTWKQADEEARIMASFLNSQGLRKGDRVALLSKNCAEWIIADLAIMMGGFISVPLYANITAPTIHMLLEHSGTKAIFVGKLDKFIEQERGLLPEVTTIYFDAYGLKGSFMWSEVLTKHEPLSPIHHAGEADLVTIIYTSGTTGNPKGVMHSVEAINKTLTTFEKFIRIPHGKFFSFLPVSHIAERIGIEMFGIYTGSALYFSHSLESFAADLSRVQPDIFFAVPRIWAKFKEKINEKLSDSKLETLLKIPLVNLAVRNKIKKGLGLAKAKYIFSGAAPISVELMNWYKKLGIEICQCYGMTEDCVYCHFSLPGQNRFGAVGKPLPGLIVRLSEDNEIQVKCSGLMEGYYREPELTAEVMTEDGFLKTGDRGKYDEDGFLYIIGRTKDQFKTDKGKFISPASIEMKLCDDPMIEQACVVGMGIPQPIGLIVLSEKAGQGSRPKNAAYLVDLKARINLKLENQERLEKLVVLPKPWTVENGLMTPTLKIKRNEVEKIYEGIYKEWFSHSDPIIWV